MPEFTDGSGDFFTRTDGSDIGGFYSVTGFGDSFYFAAMDLDGEGASLPTTLTFSGIDISGVTNLGFSGLFAEDDDGSNQDWDNSDFFLIEYQIDGGGFQNLFAIENDGSEFNSAPSVDTDFDGSGDGTEITSSFQTFMAAIAGTGSTFDLRLTFNLDSGDEDIALDDIEITGDVASAAPLISEFQPNPDGSDPTTQTVELSGQAGQAFDLWLVSIEDDGNNGTVDRAANVTGTFDANGLATVSVPDLENPSFTYILTESFTGTAGGTDIDTDDDGFVDDLSAFGTILDAVGIVDDASESSYANGSALNGIVIAYTGAEPELVFRDASRGEWFAVNAPSDTDVYDATGATVAPTEFDTDPTASADTFGAINPTRTAGSFDLQITELWPGNEPGSNLSADWFEIVNAGSATWTAVTDGPLFYDDESQDPTTADPITGITSLAPGERAVVIIDDNAASVGTFETLWGAVFDLAGIQIGLTDGSGLGQGGDGATLYVDTGNDGAEAADQVDFESFPDANATGGQSYDVDLAAFSTIGNANGALATTTLNDESQPAIGSPGNAPALVAPTLGIQITEIWPGQDGTDVTEDWFEIKNTGTATWTQGVDPDLYYDDDSADPTAADLIEGLTSLAPGETAIVVIGAAGDATSFETVWGPVIDLTGVEVGYTDGAGLGAGGDAVNIWLGDPTATGTILDTEAYPDTTGNSGKSYDVENAEFSQDGTNGATSTLVLGGTGGTEPAIGSPGDGAALAPLVGRAVPYSFDFETDLTAEGWSVFSVDADTANSWYMRSFSGDTFVEVNAFGDSAAANDWLISPAFDLDQTDREIVSFANTKNFDDALADPEVTFLYSTDYTGTGDPTAATWTELPYTASTGSYSEVSSGEIDISGISGGAVHFAFQYQSTGTSGGSSSLWQIDDFEIAQAPLFPDAELIPSIAGGVGLAGAEIVDFDPASDRAFVTSSSGLQVVDASDPTNPTLITTITPTSDWLPSNDLTSVSVKNGIVAIAIPNPTITDSGNVAFYDAATAAFLGSVTVGALPDGIAFDETGTYLVVANEGQSADGDNAPDGVPNPNGSVSIVDISDGIAGADIRTFFFTDPSITAAALKAKGVRIDDRAPSPAADIEPEFVSIVGTKAFVTLQENNAVLVIDDITAPTGITIDNILPLGTKDHSAAGNGLDASDRDSGINIQTWAVQGLFMPDGVASYEVGGVTYFVTANEGDARDEDDRVKDLTLDPTAFPNAATLQLDENLGRLDVSTVDGDTDGDGDFDQLFSYGARSFSIWDEAGNLVYDSGDLIAQTIATAVPAKFNSQGDAGSFDNRSDNKGAEPESVVLGDVNGQTYAFVALERVGGVMVFDVTDPLNVTLDQYIEAPGDIAPEGLKFIPADDSPTGKPLLAMANEVSNTLTFHEFETKTPAPVGIHEVQGSGAVAALDGQTVTVEGVVTGVYNGDDQLGGFFLQEEDAEADADAATSEGIFVFTGDNGPAVAEGQIVRVTGLVEEFFDMTQIDTGFDAGAVTIVDAGDNLGLITPATIDLPAAGPTNAAATFEAVEGMLVEIADQLVVSEYFQLARFGEIVLYEGDRPQQFTQTNMPDAAGYAAHLEDLASRRILLDDLDNDQNSPLPDGTVFHPQPGGFSIDNFFRGGDTVENLTGVMHWSWAGFGGTEAWRIRPTEANPVTFAEANPRPTEAPDDGGTLKVVSFNVLNYFSTIDDGAAGSGPNTLEPRGADSQAELDRQTDKLVSALLEIDADIYGLIEIENEFRTDQNGDGRVAVDYLVDALNAVAGAGTFASIDPGRDFVDTGDAISQAFIYKTATVEQTEGTTAAILDDAVVDTLGAGVDPGHALFDGNGSNRASLAATFTEIATGEDFTIAANHFKSKGSVSPFGNNTDQNDGAGNNNEARTQAAVALDAWLATNPTGSDDEDWLILGDLNAYAMEDPITFLEGAGYTDLVRLFDGSDAYSYVFDGQTGTLDYVFGNAPILDHVTGVSDWRINADEVNLFDYNDGFDDTGEQFFEAKPTGNELYSADPFRTSDHDPIIVSLNFDSTPPDLSAVDLIAASDTGTFDNDNITDDATPTIEVTAEAGAEILIDWGDGNGFVPAGTGTGAPQQFTLDTPYAATGAKTITVRAVDAALNETEQSLIVTYDTFPFVDIGGGDGEGDGDDDGGNGDTDPTVTTTVVDGAPVVTTTENGIITREIGPFDGHQAGEDDQGSDGQSSHLVAGGSAALGITVTLGLGGAATVRSQQGLILPNVAETRVLSELGLIDPELSDGFPGLIDPELLAEVTAYFDGVGDSDLPVELAVVTPTATPVSITGGDDASRGQIVIVDARDLPAGSTIELDDIEFAIVLGDVEVVGGAGDNVVVGDGGAQSFILGEGDDVLIGTSGDDRLESHGGDDLIDGGKGFDTLIGGAENDTLIGGSENDTLDGGSGVDTARTGAAQSDSSLLISSLNVLMDDRSDMFGSDTLEEIELIEFSDSTLDLSLIDGGWQVLEAQLIQLVELYAAYFDRAPSAIGVNYWATRLADGMDLPQIAKSFFVQPETKALFPDPADYDTFVSVVFEHTLGRPPAETGKTYYVNELKAGNIDPAAFVLAVINGAKAPTGSPVDAQYLADKADAGLYYAVTNGLTDYGNSQMVMEVFETSGGDAGAVKTLVDGMFQDAIDGTDPELIVQLLGVADDPYAV